MSQGWRSGSNGTAFYALVASLLLTLAACSSDSASTPRAVAPTALAADLIVAYTQGPLRETAAHGAGDASISGTRFRIGTDLFVSGGALEPQRNVTAEVTRGIGDVADLEIAPDGGTLLFALRGPTSHARLDRGDTWDIWEYSLAEQRLRRVIASDAVASAGHDRFPRYLPDGRITFWSTRSPGVAERAEDDRHGAAAARPDTWAGAPRRSTRGSSRGATEYRAFAVGYDGRPQLLPWLERLGPPGRAAFDLPLRVPDTAAGSRLEHPGAAAAPSRGAGGDPEPARRGTPIGQLESSFALRDGSGRVLSVWSMCRVVDAGMTVPCSDALLSDPTVLSAPPVYGLWLYSPEQDAQQRILLADEGLVIDEAIAMPRRRETEERS